MTIYPAGKYRLADVPLTYVNLRVQPSATSADLGDLYPGTFVTLTGVASGDWLEAETADGVRGWVSQQGGAVVFEAVEVAPPHLNGIDISQAQTPLDWAKVKAAGYSFAFIRATQGTSEKDTRFQQHIDAALAAGVSVGVYHAFIASLDGGAQADFFHATIYPYLDRLSFPLVIDVELQNGQGKRVIADRLRAMCVTLEALAGAKPMIYTSPGFMNGYVGSQWDAYFAQLPLWVAAWTNADEPLLPRPWKRGTWTVWQWQVDENGIPGYGKRIDVNRMKP